MQQRPFVLVQKLREAIAAEREQVELEDVVEIDGMSSVRSCRSCAARETLQQSPLWHFRDE